MKRRKANKKNNPPVTSVLSPLLLLCVSSIFHVPILLSLCSFPPSYGHLQSECQSPLLEPPKDPLFAVYFPLLRRRRRVLECDDFRFPYSSICLVLFSCALCYFHVFPDFFLQITCALTLNPPLLGFLFPDHCAYSLFFLFFFRSSSDNL